jgi:SH3-like domain-containing protein
LCAPFFVSIKAKEANLHVGPGQKYKVLFKYVVRWIPIVVLAKYDHWRKVKDIDGTEGWIHKNLLSTTRYVMVNVPFAKLYSPQAVSPVPVASLKKHVILKLDAIEDDWCLVSTTYRGQKYSGHVEKKHLFGVLKSE